MEQKVNYKTMIIKYVCNVVLFATAYALASFLLIFAGLSGFAVNAIAIVSAIVFVMGVMKRLGPWIDKRLGEQ